MHGKCHSQLDSGPSTATAPPRFAISQDADSAKVTQALSRSTICFSAELRLATPCICPTARRGLGGFDIPCTGLVLALERVVCPIAAMRKSAWATHLSTEAWPSTVVKSCDLFRAMSNGVTCQPHHARAQPTGAPDPPNRSTAEGAFVPVRLCPSPKSGCRGVGVCQRVQVEDL